MLIPSHLLPFEKMIDPSFLAFALSFAVVFFTYRPADACTSFSPSHTSIVAKNYDSSQEGGHIILNKRGMLKFAVGQNIPDKARAEWETTYASITFNHVAPEFPQGGMNENGLVIETLRLRNPVAPQQDSISINTNAHLVNELQAVQYWLDSFSNIDEVVNGLPATRVQPSPYAPLIHYFICDATQRCITLEPHYDTDNNRVVAWSTRAQRALTNHSSIATLEDEKTYLDKMGDFTERATALSALNSSRQRLGTVSNTSSTNAFDILDSAAVMRASPESGGDRTRWQIAYDTHRKQIQYRSANSPQVKQLNFGDHAQAATCSSNSPRAYVNIDGPSEPMFTECTTQEYKDNLVCPYFNSMLSSKLPFLPHFLVEIGVDYFIGQPIVGYVESLSCTHSEQ